MTVTVTVMVIKNGDGDYKYGLTIIDAVQKGHLGEALKRTIGAVYVFVAITPGVLLHAGLCILLKPRRPRHGPSVFAPALGIIVGSSGILVTASGVLAVSWAC